jgi:hypothetical protein
MTITGPMMVAIAEALDEPVQIAGPGRDDARHINTHTQRAILVRKLVACYVGETLADSVPFGSGLAELEAFTAASEWRMWLVITDAGRLVLSAYILGCEHGRGR